MTRKDERGAAAVELAALLLFLVLLATGIGDLGHAIFVSVAVEDAAQEGAFFASFEDEIGGSPLSVSDIETRVISSIDRPTLTPADVDVYCTVDASAARPVHEVTVVVRTQVDLVTPIIGQMAGGSIDIEKIAVAERFTGDCPTGATPPP